MTVTKAVIPAAGLGTRMLPVSRGIPKEMLPIVDRPAISYLVEEAVEAGATDILIITARGKDSIENYFDYSPEYEEKFARKGQLDEIKKLREIAECANIYFLRQHQANGLGAAVLRAKKFTGDEPFMVLYGDDVVISEEKGACSELCDAYAQYGLGVAGVKKVDLNVIHKYCSLDAVKIESDNAYKARPAYKVRSMIEKPAPEQVFTDLAILGRVVLPPEIHTILEQTQPGAGGEIQLTDAMKILAETKGMIAVEYSGKRYDLGSKLGFLEANVEQAVHHPETGEAFKSFLKEFVSKI